MRAHLSTFMLAASLAALAQDEMTTVWETKLGHQTQYSGTGTEDRGYSYAADDKEITVFDNKTGKTIWTGRYKD
ncbi:MAG TPA: hypothetical protein PLL18_07905, partial [Flavobacteriales bacterium]|nr:hypothetical protein [Flavobacteriales bacterium]